MNINKRRGAAIQPHDPVNLGRKPRFRWRGRAIRKSAMQSEFRCARSAVRDLRWRSTDHTANGYRQWPDGRHRVHRNRSRLDPYRALSAHTISAVETSRPP